jgi:hypothetical protein
MNEETLKAKITWCVESIKTIADALNQKKPNVVLKDEPPDEKPPN